MPKSTVLAIAAVLLSAAGLFAQNQTRIIPASPPSTDTPPAAVPGAGPEKIRREKILREFMQTLAPDERRRVLAALKEVWQDADVRAARDELGQAVEKYKRTIRQAIEEADPTVGEAVRPLLAKLIRDGIPPAARNKAGGPARRLEAGQGRFFRLLGLTPEKFEKLTPEDRERVASVRDRTMSDERVKHAMAAADLAKDEGGGRIMAVRALRQVVKAVAIELDPELGPLLKKAVYLPAE